jgi:hypothetical protein
VLELEAELRQGRVEVVLRCCSCKYQIHVFCSLTDRVGELNATGSICRATSLWIGFITGRQF